MKVFVTPRFLQIIGGPLGSFALADARNVYFFCTQRFLQIIGGPLGSFAQHANNQHQQRRRVYNPESHER